MEKLSVFLFLISFISLIVGLISPDKFKKIFKNKEVTRKFILKVFGTASAVLFFSIGVFAGAEQKVNLDFSQPRETNKTEIVTTTELKIEQLTATTTEEVKNTTSENTKPVINEYVPKPIVKQGAVETPEDKITYYAVAGVTDGDTIKINVDGTISSYRLIGMDTPETLDPRKEVQCFGKEASNKAKELLIGKKVRIERELNYGDLDIYGRPLAYIYREDGLFYNKYMIEQGYAHEYTYKKPYKYQVEFKTAQKIAEENLRGLWSPDTCNGNTTQSASTSTTQVSETDQTTNKYYTSSHYKTKYYYPASCPGWKSLSPSYLKSFDSLEALLKVYPSRTLSPEC